MESLFSLRFFLLLIGAAIVAAIYVFGTRGARRNSRVTFDTRRPKFSPRRKAAATRERRAPVFEAEDEVFADASEDAAEIVVDENEEALALPVITKEGDEHPASPPAPRNRREENQLELNLDSAQAARRPAAATREEIFIALYVRPPADAEFHGPRILEAMSAVGLRFGELDVFHHFGAGELRTDAPLFSVANMVEPGRFNPEKMDRFATPGLAMILQLPGPLDGAVAFELFLNTAQRLAEALDGDLYSTPKKLLDSMTIDRMRRDAMPYGQET